MAEARRRANDRRSEILEHAGRLFRDQGYHATTMDDVADSVKLNKGTLYYYYESKANLLFEILLNTNERRLASMRSRAADLEPDARVKSFVEDTIEYLASHPVEATVSFQEAPFFHLWLSRDQVKVLRARYAEFEHYAVDAVSAGQKAGIFMSDLDANVIAQTLTAIVSWFVRWFRAGGKLSAHQVAEQSSLFVLRGLLTPEFAQRAGSLVGEPPSAVTDAKRRNSGSLSGSAVSPRARRKKTETTG